MSPAYHIPDTTPSFSGSFFFFNDTATTEIYTLSLHDALPISLAPAELFDADSLQQARVQIQQMPARSEEHTSELQSLAYLVCRLLLEKKKKSGPREEGIGSPTFRIRMTSCSACMVTP